MKHLITAVTVLCLFLSLFAAKQDIDLIHYEIGMKYYNEGAWAKAIEEFRKMLALAPDHAPSYYQIGLAWAVQSHHALAAYNFKKAAKYDPKNPDIFAALADAYYRNGEIEKARESLRKGVDLETDPGKKTEYENRLLEMQVGDSQDKAKVEKARPEDGARQAEVKEKPKAEEKVQEVAESKAEKPGKAADIFKLKVDERHNDPASDPLTKEMVGFYNAGEYGKALTAARALLKKKPGHPGAYYYGGIIRRYHGQLDMAVTNFKLSFKYPDRGFNAHFYLGLIYEEQKKYAEAIKEYEKYMNLTESASGRDQAKGKISQILKLMGKPGEAAAVRPAGDKPAPRAAAAPAPRSLFRSGVPEQFSFIIEDSAGEDGRKMVSASDLYLNGKYDASLKQLQAVISAGPPAGTAANALFNTGLVYARMQKWDEAQADLERVMREYPAGNAAKAAHVLRGQLFFKQGRLDSAAAAFELYLAKNPRDRYYAFAHRMLGDAAFARDDVKEALRYYLKALGQETGREALLELKFKVGECYFRQGSNRGIEYFKEAAADTSASSPAVLESTLRLGDYYYTAKNTEAALEYYRRAAGRFPKSPQAAWAVYQIANACKRGGQYEDAIKHYDRLMKEFPNDYWASQAKWKREDAVWQSEFKEVLK